MVERLLIALVLLAVGVAIFRVVRARQLSRVSISDPIFNGLTLDTPTIVYFTTPGCMPCKTRQQPALHRLKQALNGRLQVVQIDASEQPDVASRWGVQTAPTTFVIDPAGRPIAVNYGVADEALLMKQLNIA